MKRTPLERHTPLQAKTPPSRTVPLQRSKLRANQGGHHKPQAKPARKDTGPTQKVRELVATRSEGVCEWPACWCPATDVHHRLNRKNGGRHGDMAVRINQAAWLLHACRPHHRIVTSPHGEARLMALAMGWLLLEGHDARLVPVVSRHGRVWLADDGAVLTTPPPATAEEATP